MVWYECHRVQPEAAWSITQPTFAQLRPSPPPAPPAHTRSVPQDSKMMAGRGGRPTPAQYLREIAVSCRQYCANPAYSADYPRYYPVP